MRRQNLEHDWFSEPLPSNVHIGERSWLYSSFAFRHYKSQRTPGLSIGHDSGLYNGTFFDLGINGEVRIGNFCTLVGAIIATNGKVTVGDYSFIAHEVVIADSFASVPPEPNYPTAAKPLTNNPGSNIVIGENVWIGVRAIILSGAIIGEGAVVGAAAVVDFTVPAYSIVAGNPAKIRGWTRK